MPSTNRDNLTSLPFCILIISLSCVISLSKTSNTVLNKSRENGHSILFLILAIIRGNVLNVLDNLNNMVYSFSYTIFLVLKYIPSFFRAFNMEGFLTLMKTFPWHDHLRPVPESMYMLYLLTWACCTVLVSFSLKQLNWEILHPCWPWKLVYSFLSLLFDIKVILA